MDEEYYSNAVRPYTKGMIEHPDAVSTIIIYTDGDTELDVAEDTQIDYERDFTGHVNGITNKDPKGETPVNNPVSTGGKSVMLDLSGDKRNDFYGIFNNFSLTNVSESSEQIVKIQLNFGADWNAFFFGEKPRMYTFSGYFLDTRDYPYYQEFMIAYDKYMSGRKAIENRLKTVIAYDGRVLDGYILNISTQHTAADKLIKPFQFTILIRDSYWIRRNYSNEGLELNKFHNKQRVQKYLNEGNTMGAVVDYNGKVIAGAVEGIGNTQGLVEDIA